MTVMGYHCNAVILTGMRSLVSRGPCSPVVLHKAGCPDTTPVHQGNRSQIAFLVQQPPGNIVYVMVGFQSNGTWKSPQIARIMGPCRHQVGPCRPHEPCYQALFLYQDCAALVVPDKIILYAYAHMFKWYCGVLITLIWRCVVGGVQKYSSPPALKGFIWALSMDKKVHI